MFYIGEAFDKENNKEYKTLDGAKKAAEKAGLSVFDEEGVKVHPLKVQLTDDVPDGALEENADGSVNAYNEAGEKVGTVTPEEVAEAEAQITPEAVEQAAAEAKAEEAEQEQEKANQDPEKANQDQGKPEQEPDEVEVRGVIRRVFPGKLRLRRAPSFEDGTICGVTMFTEKAVTKRIKVGERTMYKTLDGYFVSGDPEHVKFIPDPVE